MKLLQFISRQWQVFGRPLQVLCALATLAPFVVLLALVARYSVNVPFWDQWEFVPILQHYRDGSLDVATLFAQHNEHRLLFPRLLMLALALPSHWNSVWECLTNVLLAGVGFVLIYRLLAFTFADRKFKWVAAVLLSVIFFSPLQYENWLWGWQLQWYLTILGLLLTVWALTAWQRTPWLRIAVAAAGAILATYSLASGMFVWFIGAALLLALKPMRRWLLPWVVLSVLSIGLYYAGYHDPGYHPSKLLLLHEPLQFIQYVFIYIGHPLAVVFRAALPLGLLLVAGLGAAGWWLWRTARGSLTGTLLPWLALALYGILAALSTAASRLGFGLEQAYSSRYTTLSQFILIAFIVVVVFMVQQLSAQKRPKGKARALPRLAYAGWATLVLCICLVGTTYAKGGLQMHRGYSSREVARTCAINVQSVDDDCLLQLYPNKQIVWERLQYLRSIGYGW